MQLVHRFYSLPSNFVVFTIRAKIKMLDYAALERELLLDAWMQGVMRER